MHLRLAWRVRALSAAALLFIPAACETPSGEEEPSDADGDGFVAASDCDDEQASVYPDAEEQCDGLDNDCDTVIDEGIATTWYVDADEDGYGDPDQELDTCVAPVGYVDNGEDCDDQAPEQSPDAEETCNGLDDDCDSKVDEGYDQDRDGYTSCDGDEGGDCDDGNAAVHPGALEVCDDLDNDCDGEAGSSSVDEADDDGDGAPNCADCGPDDATVYPGAAEVCDGQDNDCDGTTDEGVAVGWCPDEDGDLDGDLEQIVYLCADPPEGYISTCNDCDDGDSSVHPGAEEVCDGLDDDCDGSVGEEEGDVDHDGYLSCAVDGEPVDCDDSEASAHPGASEVCDDGIDQDCSGEELLCPDVDNDGDGYTEYEGDCDDIDADIHPGVSEACNDGIDNNCDGVADENGSYDQEPNDSMNTAIDLGTLNESSETSTCRSPDGQLSTASDVDYYHFYSVDDINDDWQISAVVTVPAGVTYCVDLLDETGVKFSETVCASGPDQAINQVDFVWDNATGDYWIRIYADGDNSCAPYTLTACGY